MARPVMLALSFLSAGLASMQPCSATPFEWEYTGSLKTARYHHTSTLLPDGRVLVVGGEDGHTPFASAELYDPATGTWSDTGSLISARDSHTATLLPNGMVLVAGGREAMSLTSAELYDPATATWTATGSLHTGRVYHTATLLPKGIVLVVGGSIADIYLASAELYDPATGIWSPTGSFDTGRIFHTTTLLADGKVLIAGGRSSDLVALASAELYDPATGTWSATGSLNTARYDHTATLLPNGMVLVAGGHQDTGGDGFQSAELYNPSTGTWSITGSLNNGRADHVETLLPNGTVLVADGTAWYLSSAELYDPAAGTWSLTGSLNTARKDHAATLLPNGMVLVTAGALAGKAALASAELYDPGIVVATKVDGRGHINSQGDRVTFQFRASQSADSFSVNSFSFCDPAAGVCLTNAAGIRNLSISGNTAQFNGKAHLDDGTNVHYTVSVTDNGEPGTLDTMSIPYLRICHDRGLGVADPRDIEVVGDSVEGESWGFTASKSLVIWGDQMLRLGPLRFLEKLALHSPLVVWAPFASNVYHDWIWYPTVGRARISRFKHTKWGRLFDERYGGGSPMGAGQASPLPASSPGAAH